MDNLKIKDKINQTVIDKPNLIDNIIDGINEDILNSEFFDNMSEDGIYYCSSCRMQVDIVNGDKGFCENCESIVFIEKA